MEGTLCVETSMRLETRATRRPSCGGVHHRAGFAGLEFAALDPSLAVSFFGAVVVAGEAVADGATSAGGGSEILSL